MNYCQFRNETIKRMANAGGALLPPEYQQVEYLLNSGTQYIDTRINASADLQVTLDFKLAPNFSFAKDYFLFGAWTVKDARTHYCTDTPNFTQMRFSGSTTVTVANMGEGINTLIYRSGYQEYNGEIISTTTASTQTLIDVYLFGVKCIRDGAYSPPYICSGLQVYNFKMGTSLDDAAYRHYIPCYRKSDSKPGMYDLVTSTFFTNAGTGEFTVGNDVYD